MAMHRRLGKEIPILRKKSLHQDGFAIELDANAGTDVVDFVALLAGPRDSPYEGGVFRLQVSVPPKYPMEPPKMKFATRIFHPNVGRGHTPGAICLDILRKEAWSPALTLERTLLSIASLLADPNPASPMDSEAGRLYQSNRPAYNKRVREWVDLYAKPAASAGTYVGDLGKADNAEAEGSSAPAISSAPAALRQDGGAISKSAADSASGTAADTRVETAETERALAAVSAANAAETAAVAEAAEVAAAVAAADAAAMASAASAVRELASVVIDVCESDDDDDDVRGRPAVPSGARGSAVMGQPDAKRVRSE
eukprot:TRINITY_DN68688_c0_g1_i1.p1 TRINITY_DN68688_c0_g1~~TRINITY_DN68688_c0_g1_i1.p1  ORF type:complete len:346 (+),score=54.53 TRINITY_DN68688_c0_g1_i1:105-1040(+)